jgi:hypothetical protein
MLFKVEVPIAGWALIVVDEIDEQKAIHRAKEIANECLNNEVISHPFPEGEAEELTLMRLSSYDEVKSKSKDGGDDWSFVGLNEDFEEEKESSEE